MRQDIEIQNFTNEVDGNPTGGYVSGIGLRIDWQNGPIGRGEDKQQPNGAFLQDVIEACIERLRYYQEGKFACKFNEYAIKSLEDALESLDDRKEDREAREVQGTYKI